MTLEDINKYSTHNPNSGSINCVQPTSCSHFRVSIAMGGILDKEPMSEIGKLHADIEEYQKQIHKLEKKIELMHLERENVARAHETEITNLTNDFLIASENALAAAVAAKEDEVRRQLEEQRNDGLRRKEDQLEAKRKAARREQRLKSVKVYDDGGFVHLGGEGKLNPRAFPFADLRVGHLADLTHVLRIQLKDGCRNLEDLEHFRDFIAAMQSYVYLFVQQWTKY